MILGNAAKKHTNNVVKCQTVKKGLNIALQRANKGDMILCTGSHYTVGEFVTSLRSGSAL